jgi:hypothetical protein
MAQIKGMALLGLIRRVKEAGGEERLAQLIGELPPSAQGTFGQPIVAGAWYPYEAFARLLAAVARRLGAGRPEYLEDLGRAAAVLDTGTIFKVVAALFSVRRALHRSEMLWSRYCDGGKFLMVNIGETSAEGRIEGFPEISIEHERLVAGWMAGIGTVVGALHPRVELVDSIHQGAPASVYALRWVNK